MLLSEDVRRRERARRRREPLWGLLSFLLHLAAFTAVVLLTPVRKIVIPENAFQKPAMEISANRLEAMSETLSAVRMAELIRHIANMQAVLHNMDVMREAIAKDFDKFAERSAADTRAELERLVAETAAAQADAVKAQEEVKAEIAALVEIEQKAELTDGAVAKELSSRAEKLAQTTSEKTITAQGNAVNALDRLQVKAEFAGYARTAEAAEALREEQIEAGRKQVAAQSEATDTARKLAGTAGRKTAADNARAEIAKANERIEKAKRESRDVERVVRNQTNAIARAEAKLAQAAEGLASLEALRKEKANDEQVEKADDAQKAQKALDAKIARLRETLAADVPARERASRGEARVENALAEKIAPEAMAEAYGLAKELEAAVTESYRDIKATETAISRKMSVAAAKAITDVARPQRMEADTAALASRPRTDADFDVKKAAEAAVVRESETMEEATVAMMDDAMRIVMAGKQPKIEAGPQTGPALVKRIEEKDLEARASDEALEERLAKMAEESEFQLAMEEAAAEDSTAKAKDIAAMMSRERREPPPDGGAGAGAEVPPLAGGVPALQPGNIMRAGDAATGVGAQWMYVTSWYVIGPFPNPNRINLRRKFPPESVQDLDATYVGKDGRTVRWEFMQANNHDHVNQWGMNEKNAAEVVPPNREEYAIFYAYAEVFMDEECDRWVAIGSDDRSDVWLNDVPVWGSSNKLKQWRLAEDFRRVHFLKGRNRILARIENGHWNFGWSLCISTGK